MATLALNNSATASAMMKTMRECLRFIVFSLLRDLTGRANRRLAQDLSGLAIT
jgi:hypothetical protein